MSFEAYQGPVESVLISNDEEILRDLVAVVEATQDRAFRLTKGGLPPKPLWSAINDRLLWQDPRSILDDWDEVDQIRFIYSLALRLGILQSDMERNLFVGVGADRFFFASPTRRAALLLRAWLEVEDWDERCDARNEYGHRYHFGQTFRRDFALSPAELRMAVVNALREQNAGEWFRAEDFATKLNHKEPSLLLADDDAPDLPPDEGPDEEFARFVDYWLYQAARFGWVNLARIEDEETHLGDRLFSITPLFERLIQAGHDTFLPEDEESWREQKPFMPVPTGEFVLYRDQADIGDEYLMRRLGDSENFPSWDEPVATFSITPESLQRAASTLLNLDAVEERLLARCQKEIAPNIRVMLEDHLGTPLASRVTLGVTAIEFEADDCEAAELARDAGFTVVAGVALVPWDRWDEYARRFGEPSEGFEYPTEEPLAHVHKAALELVWPVLPMAGRDLLERLGVSGTPLSAPLTEGIVGTLAPDWTPKSVAESLRVLADDNLPAWLSRHLIL